jgi:Ni/Co efflux regulator RcnB
MKSKPVLAAVVAMSLALGNIAYAQNNDRQNEHDRGEHKGRDQGHGNEGNRHDNDRDRRGPGAGPNHNFYRGERISSEYRHRNYVVDDWRGHHLSAPPRGYQWVQTGADYVLIAIATGIIAQILLHG